MRSVSRALLGSMVLSWLLAMFAGLTAQSAAPTEVPAHAKTIRAAFASSPAAIASGKQLFAKYCSFCHGNTGAGDSPIAPKTMKPSNLTDSSWTRGSSEGEIFWVIQNGAPPEYNMKGLKGTISIRDTWSLVHYVRSLSGVSK